jgi:renierapurpurin 18,18'-hydroxylase
MDNFRTDSKCCFVAPQLNTTLLSEGKGMLLEKQSQKDISTSTFMSGWYAILPGKEVKKQKPLAIKRLNLDLVLWRDQHNTLHCMLDKCPHRGAKLSLGKIEENCLKCPYHGFSFASDGHCQLAPEFKKPLPGLVVKTFSLKEFSGMIWLYHGNNPVEFKCEKLSAIHQQFPKSYCQTARQWHSHITYCMENQLDYTHLATVHHNTIGRGFKYPKNPAFELTEEHITISLDQNKGNALDMIFPNCWILNVGKKMRLVVYFSPINNKETLLYLRTYSNMLKLKLIRYLLAPIFNKINLVVLKQDQRVVESQGSGTSYLATDDALMRNDMAIKHFRKVWSKNLS